MWVLGPECELRAHYLGNLNFSVLISSVKTITFMWGSVREGKGKHLIKSLNMLFLSQNKQKTSKKTDTSFLVPEGKYNGKFYHLRSNLNSNTSYL